MYAIIFSLSLSLLFACGDESGSHGEFTGMTDDVGSVSKVRKIETKSQQTSSSASTGTGGQACLFDCKTEAIARLAFATPVELNDPSCTVKSFHMLPLVDGLAIVSRADCLEGEQIFYTRYNAEGLPTSHRQVASPSCYSYFSEVFDFAADTDGRDVVYAYACPFREGNTNRAKVFIAGLQGSSGLILWNRVLFVETYSWSLPNFGLAMAYNAEGKAYGLLLRSNLYRISPQGQQLGGTVNTYISNTGLASLQTQAGNWFLLSREYSTGPTMCSKINAQGILECDRKSLTASQPTLTSTGRMVWKSSSSGSFNTQFEISSFNRDTCSTSKGQVLGFDRLNTSDQILAVHELTSDTHFMLYQDTISGNLKLAVFTNKLTGNLLSIVSVAPVKNLKRASAVILGRQLHVVYLDDLGLQMNSSMIILH